MLDPARPVRWGILGAGGIARRVGLAIAESPDSVVRSVASRSRDRADDLAARLGAVASHDDYRRLADEPDLDVVYVATTHAQHYGQVRMLLEAGKSVLVEKAFTLNAEQASALASLAAARQVFCMEAMWTRCQPAFRYAVSVVQRDLGRIAALRTDLSRVMPYDTSSRLWNPEAGGGVSLDMGVYVGHVAVGLLGLPSAVQTAGRLAPNGVDATVAMQWTYPDGVAAQLTATFEGVSSDPHTVVTGADGWVAMYGRTHEPDRIVLHREGEQDVVTSWPAPGYTPQIVEVERALRAGDLDSPLVPLGDTIAVLRTLDAARASLGVSYGTLEET